MSWKHYGGGLALKQTVCQESAPTFTGAEQQQGAAGGAVGDIIIGGFAAQR